MTLVAAPMFLYQTHESLAAGLCLAAVLLDAFDGWYARTFSQCSDLGKHLDPLADKIVIGVIYLLIAFTMDSKLIWILLSCLFFRELGMTLFRSYSLRRRHIFISASRLGKLKMVVQSIVGICFLSYVYFLEPDGPLPVALIAPPLIIIILLAYISAWQYIRAWRIRKAIRAESTETKFKENSSERLAVGK
jgi:CDP-diacylglycerol--glycerol-3-phosphate 3-phosphatidyltransferase